MGNKLCPKVIFEGTRLTFKTEIAFELNEHPRIMGPGKYRCHSPLIFSRSPSVFDEQIAFTLRAYRGANWETLQKEQRPSFGNPGREAETAEEETGET